MTEKSPPPRRRKAKPSEPTKELFGGAPHQTGVGKGFGRVPDLQRGFQTIVRDLFADGYDVRREWEDIRDAMEVAGALTPDNLRRAANGQESIALRAHRLYLVGKVEVQAYMRETESIFGAIRESAVQKLEQDKASGARTKMITDGDVTAESARLHPDEWSDICTRRERAKAMVSQLERLSDTAKSRCYTVSNMMSPGSRGV